MLNQMSVLALGHVNSVYASQPYAVTALFRDFFFQVWHGHHRLLSPFLSVFCLDINLAISKHDRKSLKIVNKQLSLSMHFEQLILFGVRPLRSFSLIRTRKNDYHAISTPNITKWTVFQLCYLCFEVVTNFGTYSNE